MPRSNVHFGFEHPHFACSSRSANKIARKTKNAKQKQNSVEEIFQSNFEWKRFIKSFKSRDELLKLKIKIKKFQ